MSNEDPFKAMEQWKTAVATLTGMKQQFIDSGWTAEGAEQAVLALLNQAGKSTK